MYPTGTGNKYITPMIVSHFPPTNSIQSTNPLNTILTQKKPRKNLTTRNSSNQGDTATNTPSTSWNTKDPIRAFLRPNLSETSPEKNPPKATPSKNTISARDLREESEQMRFHSLMIVSPNREESYVQ
uniref:Uncharacterized protein n=1 Tax=Cacopsylla melanoneura TaxID=428564 RepID=A0A8D8QLD5_9HEMI